MLCLLYTCMTCDLHFQQCCGVTMHMADTVGLVCMHSNYKEWRNRCLIVHNWVLLTLDSHLLVGGCMHAWLFGTMTAVWARWGHSAMKGKMPLIWCLKYMLDCNWVLLTFWHLQVNSLGNLNMASLQWFRHPLRIIIEILKLASQKNFPCSEVYRHPPPPECSKCSINELSDELILWKY